jgi:hypothetical protein
MTPNNEQHGCLILVRLATGRLLDNFHNFGGISLNFTWVIALLHLSASGAVDFSFVKICELFSTYCSVAKRSLGGTTHTHIDNYMFFQLHLYDFML